MVGLRLRSKSIYKLTFVSDPRLAVRRNRAVQRSDELQTGRADAHYPQAGVSHVGPAIH